MEAARAPGGELRAPPPMDAAEEEALRNSLILGSPAEVADIIDEYRRAAGGDLNFAADLYFPGLAWEVPGRAVQSFRVEGPPAGAARGAGGARGAAARGAASRVGGWALTWGEL